MVAPFVCVAFMKLSMFFKKGVSGSARPMYDLDSHQATWSLTSWDLVRELDVA